MTNCIICGKEIEQEDVEKSRINDGDKYFWHERCESDRPLAAHYDKENNEWEVIGGND